ncbi:MAG: hypothetical protein JNM31_06180 [Flavobacteriales bacterium]|nr:hypothetical protein [Flavobacteriales bacterium]
MYEARVIHSFNTFTGTSPTMPYRWSLIALFFLVGVALCAQAPKGVPAWKRWKGSGCTLTYPSAWSVAEAAAEHVSVVFRAPLDSGDTFQENLNLIVQDVGEVTMDEYVRTTHAQIAQFLQQARVLSSAPGRSADSHVFEYSGTYEGRALHWLQHVYLRNGKAYLITFTAEADMFEEYRYLAEAAMDSFTHP